VIVYFVLFVCWAGVEGFGQDVSAPVEEAQQGQAYGRSPPAEQYKEEPSTESAVEEDQTLDAGTIVVDSAAPGLLCEGVEDDFMAWEEEQQQEQERKREGGSNVPPSLSHTQPTCSSPSHAEYHGGGGTDDFLDWLETETGTVPEIRLSDPGVTQTGDDESAKSEEVDSFGVTSGANKKKDWSRRASTGPGVYVSRDSGDRNTVHTHEVVVDKKTGRRRSVLDNQIAEKVEMGGIWEADDEDDESEEDEEDVSKRMSSFNAHTSRTSTLRLVFGEVSSDGDDGRSEDGSDEEKSARSPRSEQQQANGITADHENGSSGAAKPNAMSAMFGFLARRRSSV
jgi:hypothetical protein